jgi:hypothetical protein
MITETTPLDGGGKSRFLDLLSRALRAALGMTKYL